MIPVFKKYIYYNILYLFLIGYNILWFRHKNDKNSIQIMSTHSFQNFKTFSIFIGLLSHFTSIMLLTFIQKLLLLLRISDETLHLSHNRRKYLRRTFYLGTKQSFGESFVIYRSRYLFTGIVNYRSEEF